MLKAHYEVANQHDYDNDDDDDSGFEEKGLV